MAKQKDFPKASVGKRFLAHLLDGLFTALLALLFIIPGVVYYLIKDGLKGGQSWGNRIMGLKVMHLDTGAPCTKLESMLRAVFLSVGPINLVEVAMVIFDKRGQRLADKIINTNVVEAR